MKRLVILALAVLLFTILQSQTAFFTENWETGSEGWTILNTTTPNQWVRGTAASNGTGTYSMYVSDDGGLTNHYYFAGTPASNTVIHFYKDIAIPPEQVGITLSFDIRCRGESSFDYVRVYSVPTDVTPAASTTSFTATATTGDPLLEYMIGLDRYNLNTLTNPVNEWQNVSITIPSSQSGSTRRLVFTWINDGSVEGQPPAAIDNIIITSMPATSPPMPVTLLSPANEATFVPASTSLVWQPEAEGSPATGYTLYLDTTNPPITSYTLGNVTSYTPTAALANETTYYWQVVPFNNFGSATNNPIWSFTTIEANLVVIGTGTTLAKTMPINMYYGYSLTQSIYLQSELVDMSPGSIISELTYHYTSTATIDLNEVIDVYVGNTMLTTFATTTSWIPFSELTHVYSGPITATTGDSYATVEFNLEPFIYEGGNMVIAFHENVPGYASAHSASNWFHTTYPGQNRSLYYNSDGTAANPASPPTGVLSTNVPNTMISFSEAGGAYIAITPRTINLGTHRPDDVIQQEITVRNLTSTPITVSNVTMSAGITTTNSTSFMLAAQQTLQVPFTITIPNVVAPFAGSITFIHDAQNGPEHVVDITSRIIPSNMVEILGTGSTALGIPFYPNYRYTYSQSIYLPSEIDQPNGNVIEEIRWHYNAAQNYTQQVRVFMGYTSLAVFPDMAYIPYSDLTEVYTGPATLTNAVDPATGGSWVNINLDTPFVYNNTQNLVIAVLENEAGTLGTGSFYVKTTTGENRSLTTYNDTNLYNPETLTTALYSRPSVPELLMLFGPPIQGPYLTVSPRSLNFGNVNHSSNTQRTITVGNMGTENLIISDIALPPDMSYTGSLTIAPQTTEEIVFTFTPTTEGVYNGNIVITSNATNAPSITVTATAYVIPANLVIIGGTTTTANYQVPINTYYRYSYTQSLYLASEINRTSGEVIESIHYHYNAYGSFTQAVTVYMGYTSLDAFNGTNYIPFEQLTEVYSGPFTAINTVDPITGGSWVNIVLDEPFIIDSTQNLVIAFLENQAGDYPGSAHTFYQMTTTGVRSLHSYNDATPGPYNPATLTAASASLSTVPSMRMFIGPPIQGPYIGVTPRDINFNNVSQGSEALRAINVKNMGPDPLIISDITLPPDITSSFIGSLTIQPQTTESITFTLTPTVEGAYSGNIVITSNATNNPSITIPATAIVIPANLVVIGEGTATAFYTVPINNFYRYSATQSIYLASEINRASGETIETIQYHFSAYGNFTQEVTVYMGYTSQNTFTGTTFIPFSELQEVYNGPFTGTDTVDPETGGSWVTLELEEPFVYDALQNLVIGFVENEAGNYPGTSYTFYQMPTTGTRSLAIQNDTAGPYDPTTLTNATSSLSYVPKIRMYIGEPIQGPYISYAPRVLNFNNISIGNTAQIGVSLQNMGTEPVVVNSVTLPPSITSSFTGSLTIAPNTIENVIFTFTATTEGANSGDVVITSNATNNPSITIPTSAFVVPANLVIIGGGTSTANYQVPINTFYRYSYTQSIYLASEMNRTSGEIIESIQYHYNAYGNFTQAVTVYMGYTSQTVFDGTTLIPFDELQEVYSGPFTATDTVDPVTGGSWVNIVLNEPFVIDATQNLVIAFLENQDGAYPGSAHTFYQMPTAGVRSLHSYTDTTTSPYDPATMTNAAASLSTVPSIRMYIGPPIVGPYIGLSPRAFNYNNVSQGSSANRTVTVRNMGTEPLIISNIALPTDMTSSFTGSLTIDPQTTDDIIFTLSPTTQGAYTGDIVITSNATNSPSVTLTATANVIPANLVIIGESTATSNYYVPTNTYYVYSYTQSIYHASEINRASGEVIESIQYHYNAYGSFTYNISVYMGYTAQDTFTGTTLIPFADLTEVYNGPFEATNNIDPVTGGAWVTIILDTPFEIDATQNLVIAVLDSEPGTYPGTSHTFYHMPTTGTRSLYSCNDSTGPYDPATMTTATTTLSYVPNIRMYIGPPIVGAYITVSPTRLNFGMIDFADSASLPVTISNRGTAPLTVNSITYPSYMTSTQNMPLNITSGASQIVNFTLTNMQAGYYNENIVINSTAPNNPSITINAQATLIPEPQEPDNLIYVGNGTLTNQSIPVEPFYRYTYSQTIYTPADLAELDDGAIITHIGYNFNGDAVIDQSIRIYMGYTNQSSYEANASSYINANNLTLVHVGAIVTEEIPDSWAMIQLIQPFDYDASQNLVVAMVEYQGGPYGSSTSEFFCTETTSAQSITNYNDSSPYNELNYVANGTIYARSCIPNTAFGVTSGGLPRPRALHATAGYGRVSLSWTPPNIPPELTDAFVGYKVYRNSVDIAVALPIGLTQYVDMDGQPGVIYNYWIVAEYLIDDVAVESSPSNVVAIASLSAFVEYNPPTNLRGRFTRQSVTLNWQPGLTVLNENFEGSLNPLWYELDYDGNGACWQISQTGGAVDDGGYIYSSSIDADGFPIPNNYNFLASPGFTVGAEGTWLNYWMGAYDANTSNETYWLMVASPASTNFGDFRTIQTNTLTDHNWTKYSVNLAPYVGQYISIAFMHIAGNSPNRNRLKLDGFEVVRPNEGQDPTTLPSFYKVYMDGVHLNGDGASQTTFTLESEPGSGYEIWVTGVYTLDGGGTIESERSNIVREINVADSDEVIVPIVTKLSGNYPNPFNPSTTIRFDMNKAGRVVIDIFNIKGQKVRELVSGVWQAGQHSVVWNGTDNNGRAVSSGVYFYRMQTEGYSGVKKMLLMK